MKFYGIGVGPGDEKLLTIKAVETLKILDVLLIPETQKNKDGVAKKIANKYLKSDLEIVYIDFPMVENEEVFIKAGKKAADIIEENVKKGKNVGFITLGDPSVYSTYGYIVKAVKGRVDIETIPGITSFCAAAAMANVPLVEKDEILSIIPMNANDEKIKEIMSFGDAFAFMKVYHREKRLIKLLEENDAAKKAILALRCGFKEEEIKNNAVEALEENNEYLSLVLTRKECDFQN
jgi:precorrin-2/cobalt-factor-2 C20-methyltransferase